MDVPSPFLVQAFPSLLNPCTETVGLCTQETQDGLAGLARFHHKSSESTSSPQASFTLCKGCWDPILTSMPIPPFHGLLWEMPVAVGIYIWYIHAVLKPIRVLNICSSYAMKTWVHC